MRAVNRKHYAGQQQTSPSSLIETLGLSIFLFFVLSGKSFANEDTKEKDHIKYYYKGMSSGMHPYNEELVLLALKKSSSTFGEYKLSYYNEQLSPARSRVETELNRLVNITMAGSWTGEYANIDEVIPVCVSQFQNLLGLRAFIIREDDQGAFARISTRKQLQEYVLVQDKTWPDGKIIQHNGFKVTGYTGMDSLLRTISNKRVDYLPLSILEAQNLLDHYAPEFADLSVSDDVLLFYPHPSCIYVSAKTPNIAKRLNIGIQIAKEDGSMDALFSKHFSAEEKLLKSKRHLTILLENPTLSQETNTQITNEFIARFEKYLTIAD